MVCFAIVFVAIAKAPASWRTVVAAGGSYVVLVAFGDMHGYPLNFLPQFAQSYFAGNMRLLHVLPEAVTVSLILVYIACCWFVSDAKLKQSSQMGGMLTSHTDASHPTAF
jgi:hypothetical protein